MRAELYPPKRSRVRPSPPQPLLSPASSAANCFRRHSPADQIDPLQSLKVYSLGCRLLIYVLFLNFGFSPGCR